MPNYEYNKDFPFAAFVTNLGKYNEGELVGEWVKMPTTAEEMQKVFERIGIGAKDDFGIPYEEWFITDYDCYVDGLYDKLGEYADLDELNYLAARLDEMDRFEYDQFQAAMEMGDHCGSIQEIINLCDNLDCYMVYPDITSHEDLGRYYIQELEALSVPEHLIDYIDYESYGRDIAINDGGTFTDFGYVYDTGDRFVEFYDGDRENIPEEYRVMSIQAEEEISEEELPGWAMDIAYDMDAFFRQHDPQYTAEHPDIQATREAICEKLTAGRIADYEEKLSALGLTKDDPISTELEKFKDASGYEEWLDFDPAEVKALLDDPSHSHADEMVKQAIAAEQDYREELFGKEAAQADPRDHITGENVATPRGTFRVTNMSREQMEAAGYGFHHQSEDGKHLIMGNGTRAFAVSAEQSAERDNPLRTAEMTVEDDYGMIDGVINNGRRDEALEKPKSSIHARLEEAKQKCAERKPPEKGAPAKTAQEHDAL